eukprot:10129_3
MRPATSVGLSLLVYETLSYQCMRLRLRTVNTFRCLLKVKKVSAYTSSSSASSASAFFLHSSSSSSPSSSSSSSSSFSSHSFS